MMLGAAIECVATCLCRLMSRVLNDAGVKGAQVMDAFFATAMVVAGNRFIFIT